jgi:prepilin-type N-terminal cleavage/methylation domain-containing protein
MFHTRRTEFTPRRSDSGFTLVEVLVVVALIAISAGIVVPLSASMATRAKADSTSREIVSWLQLARQRATTERRNFTVAFDTVTNSITIARVEATGPPTTILSRR